MVKPILQKSIDEVILRTNSSVLTLEEILSGEINQLKTDLIDTLRAQKAGVGISSVQIGKPVRLFVIEIKPTPNRPELKQLGPIFIFNPEIVKNSDSKVEMYEACLSINNADLYGSVSRVDSVSLKYLDENGNEVIADYDGFLARVILHEMDHLNGKLFTDSADSKTLMTGEEYKKMKSKK